MVFAGRERPRLSRVLDIIPGRAGTVRPPLVAGSGVRGTGDLVPKLED